MIKIDAWEKNNNIELEKSEIIVNDKINIIIIKRGKNLYVIHYGMFTISYKMTSTKCIINV